MSIKIGILLIGVNGSIATTLTSGILALNAGLSRQHCLISEQPEFSHLDLPELSSLRLGGWDINTTKTHLDCAQESAEVPASILEDVARELSLVETWDGVEIDIDGSVGGGDLLEVVQKVRRDIASFIDKNGLDGAVVVNLSSACPPRPDAYSPGSISELEVALAERDVTMTADIVYAYSAILEGCPVVNFTPNDMLESQAIIDLAIQNGVPLVGRDGKTGQTFYKTVLAPAFIGRALNITGWFSTNILGNNDGKTLSKPQNQQGKIRSKRASIDSMIGDQIDHQVYINHYAPRRDKKEAWDCIDIQGWMGAEIQMRVNWIAADSALAAPMVIDLVRFSWWAKKTGRYGEQRFLASFFKDPGGCDTHAYHEQLSMLYKEAK